MARRLLSLLAALAVLAAAGCAPRLNADYWRAYEAEAVAKGRLRIERAPRDAPITEAGLIRTFREIIFYDEYVSEEGAFVARRVPRRLEKFSGPVRYAVAGSAVTASDRAHIRDMMARMRRVTGLDIAESDDQPDIVMLILGAADRRRIARHWRQSRQWGSLAEELANDLPDVICAAYYSAPEDMPDAGQHVIVIRDEVSGLLRRACIEEEIGQTFGPAADYDGARPSIFNDNEEFALLTVHDELIFRVLYDPRLTSGMTEDEAMPIVRRIVREVMDEFLPATGET